jgi:signal transduction histidine kinase
MQLIGNPTIDTIEEMLPLDCPEAVSGPTMLSLWYVCYASLFRDGAPEQSISDDRLEHILETVETAGLWGKRLAGIIRGFLLLLHAGDSDNHDLINTLQKDSQRMGEAIPELAIIYKHLFAMLLEQRGDIPPAFEAALDAINLSRRIHAGLPPWFQAHFCAPFHRQALRTTLARLQQQLALGDRTKMSG